MRFLFRFKVYVKEATLWRFCYCTASPKPSVTADTLYEQMSENVDHKLAVKIFPEIITISCFRLKIILSSLW
jgi:hypothetical protein